MYRQSYYAFINYCTNLFYCTRNVHHVPSQPWLHWYQEEVCLYLSLWENNHSSRLNYDLSGLLMSLWSQLLVLSFLQHSTMFMLWFMFPGRIKDKAGMLNMTATLVSFRISAPAPPPFQNMVTSGSSKQDGICHNAKLKAFIWYSTN